jgi:hypothetical protein
MRAARSLDACQHACLRLVDCNIWLLLLLLLLLLPLLDLLWPCLGV